MTTAEALTRAIADPTFRLPLATLEAAATALNYGGSYDDAATLSTFVEARAQHPAYTAPDRAQAMQVFRLRVQELLGVVRDL